MKRATAARTGLDAFGRAQEVVGLYGDPLTTWGIGIEVLLTEPLDAVGAGTRLRTMFSAHPHLGLQPLLEEVDPRRWAATVRHRMAAPFHPAEPLVRVLVDASRTRLCVVAHHGVVDGLGLLALIEECTATSIRSRARGVAGRPAQRSFLVSGMLRLMEALFRPPTRFRGRQSDEGGERLLHLDNPPLRLNSALVCLAVGRVHREWGRTPASRRSRFLVLLGASRRDGSKPRPDRQTAYFRVAVDARWTLQEAEQRLSSLSPEPDFPETSVGGVGPWVTRLFRNRLGGAAVVSNLGLIETEEVEVIRMYPALNGPQAVGIGVVTTAGATSVTLRTRSADFSPEESRDLLNALVRELRALSPDQ